MRGGLKTEVLRTERPLGGFVAERRPVDDPAWTSYVRAHPDATPFHEPAWVGVLGAAYHYPTFALVVLGSGGEIVGGAPAVEVRDLRARRHWVALAFTDVLSPLIAPGLEAGTFASLLNGLREAKGVSSIEVRAPLAPPGSNFESGAVVHALELVPDCDAVLSRLSAAQARQVRKAERSGIEVVRGSSPGDLVSVYYDLHVRTRRRQGIPPQPRRFFRLLWERVLEPGLGFVLLAYLGRRAIAGSVFLASGSEVVYKFGASLPEFWRLGANPLLLSRAIKWGCNQGFGRFDFGKTDSVNTGLRAFKSSFGAVERPLVCSTLGPPRRRSELTVGRASAGAAFLRVAPLAVCRGMGALLYRYAA
jgi:CelD/BcsL family acetyltransferase involved in cellulose biosynthesis